MFGNLPWSDNPRDYLRSAPGWYELYRTVSRPRMSRRELADRLGLSEDVIARWQGVGRWLHRDKKTYTILDLAACTFLKNHGMHPAELEFWERMVHEPDDIFWQSLVGVVQGKRVFIAADFKRTITLPYLHSEGSEDSEAQALEIEINPALEFALLTNKWSDFTVEAPSEKGWAFLFPKKGYLMLEPMPPEPEQPAEPDSGARDAYGHKNLTPENLFEVDPFYHGLVWWSFDVSPISRPHRIAVRGCLV